MRQGLRKVLVLDDDVGDWGMGFFYILGKFLRDE
jgi:hypothetical protein